MERDLKRDKGGEVKKMSDKEKYISENAKQGAIQCWLEEHRTLRFTPYNHAVFGDI
jgi:hypothetical protein